MLQVTRTLSFFLSVHEGRSSVRKPSNPRSEESSSLITEKLSPNLVPLLRSWMASSGVRGWTSELRLDEGDSEDSRGRFDAVRSAVKDVLTRIIIPVNRRSRPRAFCLIVFACGLLKLSRSSLSPFGAPMATEYYKVSRALIADILRL